MQGRIQTFVKKGAPTPTQGHLPNTLIQFSGKPYEIKEILVLGRGAGAPPLDPQLQSIVLLWNILLYTWDNCFICNFIVDV